MTGELLSLIYFDLDCFIIVGHFNKPQEWEVTELYCHTLNSKGWNISSVMLTDIALPEHFCLFFEITIFVHIQKETIYQCEIFITASSHTTAISHVSVKLVNHFSCKITKVSDVIAPTVVKLVKRWVQMVTDKWESLLWHLWRAVLNLYSKTKECKTDILLRHYDQKQQ